MKRLLAAAVLLSAAAAARADDLTGRLGLGLTAGAAVPFAGDTLNDRARIGPDLGLWGAYGLDPRWSVGGSYDNIGFSHGHARIQPLLGTVGYALSPESIWNPTVRGGVGVNVIKGVPGGKVEELGFDAGFGVTRFITRCVSVGADIDWIGGVKTGQPDVHALRAGLTAGIWFGGPKKARAVAARSEPAPAPRPAAAPAPAPKPAPAPAPKQKASIALSVQFDTGKAVVKSQYDDELKKVADFLKKHPDATAEIEGHTDNVGKAESNRALSQRRADAVRQALIDRFGVNGSRLTAKGYGPDKPLVDNKTPENRAKNRRVVATFASVE